MKNLFSQACEFSLTEKITGEIPNVATVEVVNNAFNEKAKRAEEAIEKIKKRKVITTLIALVAYPLVLILIIIPIFVLVLENYGDQRAITVFLILFLFDIALFFIFKSFVWNKYKNYSELELFDIISRENSAYLNSIKSGEKVLLDE